MNFKAYLLNFKATSISLKKNININVKITNNIINKINI